MPNQAAARALESDIVGRLAKFFPDATPVRIPIKLSRARQTEDKRVSVSRDDELVSNSNSNSNNDNDNDIDNDSGSKDDNVFFQDTVIEFGTPHEVLFMVNHPLEFADRVLVESTDGSLHAEASVVAVQYHPERTAVAARFLKQVPNWIVKS